jgi:TPR repeat protein
VHWYTLAIEEADDSEAMFRLGQIYEQDKNDEIDSPDNGDMKAVYWYQRAISKDDHPRAHFKLAFYYVQGITASFGEKHLLSPDLVIAARHFRKSAQANDPDAMIELGQLLLSRHNQDNALFEPELQEEGILWLETAVEQGSRDACRELGNLYHSGRESSETNNTGFFPVYPICQDFEKSFDYFNSAANLDDKTSALFLGSYYEHGICVPPNINLAKSWYSAAIELGSSSLDEAISLDHPLGWWPAQLCLARVLYQSNETRKEAYSLFMAVYKHQPEQHMPYLEFILAQYYLYGYGGVEINAEEAVLKLTNLADCGHTKALFHLAQCYERGLGVKTDPAMALHWYVQLVHNPVSDPDNLDEDDLDDLCRAYFRLAEFYRLGEVVPVDNEKANLLYRIAAERGTIINFHLNMLMTKLYL